MKKQETQRGFIALMATIITSLILTTLMFVVSTSSFYARADSLGSEAKRISLGLAESCSNMALLNIARNYNYDSVVTSAGGEDVEIGTDDQGLLQKCRIKSVTIASSTAGQKTLVIASQAEYRGAFSNITAGTTVYNPNVTKIPQAYITVSVILGPGGTKQPSDFPLFLDGASVVSGQTIAVSPSVLHTLSTSTTPTGYTSDGKWIGNCASDGTITPTSGSGNSCAIYYTVVPTTASLTLIANIPIGANPAQFPLTLTRSGSSTPLGTVTSGVPTTTSPGSYTFGYSMPSGYTTTGWDCPSPLVLSAGQSQYCTVTFTQPSISCANTVVMLDRSGSMFSDPAYISDEKNAGKALLDLYSTITPHPLVAIGRFDDVATGNSAEIIPGAHATSSYGNNSASASMIGPSLPTGFGGGIPASQQWTSPVSALTNDASFMTATVVGKQQGFGGFGMSLPTGAVVGTVDITVSGKVASAGGGTPTESPQFAPSGTGNFSAWTANATSTPVPALATNNGDGSYISIGAVGTSTFSATTSILSTIPAGSTINAVDFKVVAEQVGASGATANIKLIMEKGVTSALQKSDGGHNLTGTYATVSYLPGVATTTNPVTGLTWSSYGVTGLTELNQMRFGVVRTNATGRTPRVTQLFVTVNYTPPATPGSVGVEISTDNGSSWTTTGTSTTFTTVESAVKIGGLWGRATSTWTPSALADGQFLVRLTNNTSGGITTSVNYVTAKVSYALPTSGLYAAIENGLPQSPQSYTNLSAAIDVSVAELNTITNGKQKVIIIISDGEPNRPTNSATAKTAASSSAKTAKDAVVKIFAIHFGSTAGRDFLAQLATASVNDHGSDVTAENNDGDSFFISPSSDQMPAIFQVVGAAACPAVVAATQAHLNVVTTVINNDGGVSDESAFTMNLSGGTPLPNTFAGSSAGVAVSVTPDVAVSVVGTSPSGYFAPHYSNCTAVSVSAGETKTCTVIYDDTPATLPPPTTTPPPSDIDIGSWVETATSP